MENINQQFEEWWKVYGEHLSPMAKNVARSAYRAGYESRPTLLAPDVAYWLCKKCGAAQYKDFDICGDCNTPRR